MGMEAACGFINAVLRNLSRGKDEIAWPDREADPVAYLSVMGSMPRWLVDKLVAFIQENKIEEIVLGHPKNMDGTVGPRAEKCETLAKELEERTGLHVVLWDERRTTVAAHEILHRSGRKEKKHRQNVDAVAATLILQGYLDSLCRDEE